MPCILQSYQIFLAVVGIMLPLKWENSSLHSKKLIHFCKKLPLALDCGHSFSILGVDFAVPFLCYF